MVRREESRLGGRLYLPNEHRYPKLFRCLFRIGRDGATIHGRSYRDAGPTKDFRPPSCPFDIASIDDDGKFDRKVGFRRFAGAGGVDSNREHIQVVHIIPFRIGDLPGTPSLKHRGHVGWEDSPGPAEVLEYVRTKVHDVLGLIHVTFDVPEPSLEPVHLETQLLHDFREVVHSPPKLIDTLSELVDTLSELVDTLTELIDTLPELVDTLTELVHALAELVHPPTQLLILQRKCFDALPETLDNPGQRQEVLREDDVAHTVTQLRVRLQLRDELLDVGLGESHKRILANRPDVVSRATTWRPVLSSRP